MKQTILMLFASGICISAFSQTEAEPCCGIIHINQAKSIVTVRDKITGRIYQYKADAKEIRSVKLNDAVQVSGRNITSVGNNIKTYGTVKPDYGEPCCNIINIQPDNAEPCCSAVTIQNNLTNKTNTINIPREVAASLKPGFAVFVNGDSMAIFQFGSLTDNSEVTTYGFPFTGGGSGLSSVGSSATSDNARYVMKSSPSIKGVLGRLYIDALPDVEYTFLMYQPDGKYLTSFNQSNKSGGYNAAPGMYRLQITSIYIDDIPVEKGKETRVKAGYLKIVSDGNWEIYDSSGKDFQTSGNKHKKIALPVGNYQLKLGGQFFPIEIKDRETVEM